MDSNDALERNGSERCKWNAPARRLEWATDLPMGSVDDLIHTSSQGLRPSLPLHVREPLKGRRQWDQSPQGRYANRARAYVAGKALPEENGDRTFRAPDRGSNDSGKIGAHLIPIREANRMARI